MCPERLVEEMRSGVDAKTPPKELGDKQTTRLHQLLHEAKFKDPDGNHLSPAGRHRSCRRCCMAQLLLPCGCWPDRLAEALRPQTHCAVAVLQASTGGSSFIFILPQASTTCGWASSRSWAPTWCPPTRVRC